MGIFTHPLYWFTASITILFASLAIGQTWLTVSTIAPLNPTKALGTAIHHTSVLAIAFGASALILFAIALASWLRSWKKKTNTKGDFQLE